MPWNAPVTWTAAQLVKAADLNAQVRDNMNYLLTPSAFTVHSAAGSYSTTSTTITTIAAGFVQSITTNGGHILIGGSFAMSAAPGAALVGVDVDGTFYTGISIVQALANTTTIKLNTFLTAVAAGAHTFTPRWRVLAGTTTAAIDNTVCPAEFWAIEL